MYYGSLRPASNQSDFARYYRLIDKDTKDGIDLSAATIVFEIRDQKTKSTVLSATTDNGKITLDDVGYFLVSFLATDMQQLCAETYDFGCVVTLNGTRKQTMIGTIPVLDGVVSQ